MKYGIVRVFNTILNLIHTILTNRHLLLTDPAMKNENAIEASFIVSLHIAKSGKTPYYSRDTNCWVQKKIVAL